MLITDHGNDGVAPRALLNHASASSTNKRARDEDDAGVGSSGSNRAATRHSRAIEVVDLTED